MASRGTTVFCFFYCIPGISSAHAHVFRTAVFINEGNKKLDPSVYAAFPHSGQWGHYVKSCKFISSAMSLCGEFGGTAY